MGLKIVVIMAAAVVLTGCSLDEPDLYPGSEKEAETDGPDPTDPRPEVK